MTIAAPGTGSIEVQLGQELVQLQQSASLVADQLRTSVQMVERNG